MLFPCGEVLSLAEGKNVQESPIDGKKQHPGMTYAIPG